MFTQNKSLILLPFKVSLRTSMCFILVQWGSPLCRMRKMVDSLKMCGHMTHFLYGLVETGRGTDHPTVDKTDSWVKSELIIKNFYVMHYWFSFHFGSAWSTLTVCWTERWHQQISRLIFLDLKCEIHPMKYTPHQGVAGLTLSCSCHGFVSVLN